MKISFRSRLFLAKNIGSDRASGIDYQTSTRVIKLISTLTLFSLAVAIEVHAQVREPKGSQCTELYSDDFESQSSQWIPNFDGNDTASAGDWEQDDPEQTTLLGTAYQLGDTISGTQSLVTDSSGTGDIYSFDVDGGLTSIASPPIALPSGGTDYQFSFHYSFAFRGKCCHPNKFYVKVISDTGTATIYDDGAWVLPNPPPAGTLLDIPGQWQFVSLNLDQ